MPPSPSSARALTKTHTSLQSLSSQCHAILLNFHHVFLHRLCTQGDHVLLGKPTLHGFILVLASHVARSGTFNLQPSFFEVLRRLSPDLIGVIFVSSQDEVASLRDEAHPGRVPVDLTDQVSNPAPKRLGKCHAAQRASLPRSSHGCAVVLCQLSLLRMYIESYRKTKSSGAWTMGPVSPCTDKKKNTQ